MPSIAARRSSAEVGPELKTYSQLGVRVSAGVENVATSTRWWQEKFGLLLQLDCKNAFNSVDRAAIIRSLPEALLPIPSTVLYSDVLRKRNARDAGRA